MAKIIMRLWKDHFVYFTCWSSLALVKIVPGTNFRHSWQLSLWKATRWRFKDCHHDILFFFVQYDHAIKRNPLKHQYHQNRRAVCDQDQFIFNLLSSKIEEEKKTESMNWKYQFSVSEMHHVIHLYFRLVPCHWTTPWARWLHPCNLPRWGLSIPKSLKFLCVLLLRKRQQNYKS